MIRRKFHTSNDEEKEARTNTKKKSGKRILFENLSRSDKGKTIHIQQVKKGEEGKFWKVDRLQFGDP